MKFFSFWRSLASFRVRIALNLQDACRPTWCSSTSMPRRITTDAFRKVNPQMALPALV